MTMAMMLALEMKTDGDKTDKGVRRNRIIAMIGRKRRKTVSKLSIPSDLN